MRWVFILCCIACLACASRLDRAIAKADALRGTGDYQSALNAYQTILNEYPRNPKVAEVLLRVGDLYAFHLQERGQAMPVYRRVIQDWPWQPAALTVYERLATFAEEGGDYAGAIEALELLLQYFPAHPERDALRRRIGTFYLRLKSYTQARVEFARLLERSDLDAELRVQTLFDMAESYLLTNDATRALRYYDAIIAEYPTHELARRAWEQKIEAYTELGELGIADQLARELRALQPVPTKMLREGAVVFHPRTPQAVTVTIEVAESKAARQRGLMQRRSLPKNHGMWFVFPELTQQGFWMKDTPLALDIIFVDADFVVVDVVAQTRPGSETPIVARQAYRYALEVVAGFAAQHGLKLGTRVVWEVGKK